MSKKNKTPKNKKPNKNAEKTMEPKPNEEEIQFQGYTGKIVDVDLEATKQRAKEYDKQVIQPEIEAKQEKALQEFNEVVEGKDAFLALYNEDRLKYEIVFENKLHKIQVRHLEPGDNFKIIDVDETSIYAEMDAPELGLIQKVQNQKLDKKDLTPEEQIMWEKIEEKIQQRNAETSAMDEIGNYWIKMHEVLAQHVVDPELSVEEWKQIPIQLKTKIYNEMQIRLGTSPELDAQLFQGSG